MEIYLPIAGMTVSIPHLMFFGAIGGIASGLYGIGGGVIITPILILYGLPSSVVVGTSAVQLLGTAIAGTLRNLSVKTVDFRIGTVMFIGSYFGSTSGAITLQKANMVGNADAVVSVAFSVIMIAVLIPLYCDTVKYIIKYIKRRNDTISDDTIVTKKIDEGNKKWYHLYSNLTKIRFNILALISIGFCVGFCSGLLGIGGGVTAVPAMTYILHMPFNVATATALYQVLLISINVLLLQVKNGNVDIILGCILLLSSSIFVHVGYVLQAKIGNSITKASFAMLITFLLMMFFNKLFATPVDLFTIK